MSRPRPLHITKRPFITDPLHYSTLPLACRHSNLPDTAITLCPHNQPMSIRTDKAWISDAVKLTYCISQSFKSKDSLLNHWHCCFQLGYNSFNMHLSFYSFQLSCPRSACSSLTIVATSLTSFPFILSTVLNFGFEK